MGLMACGLPAAGCGHIGQSRGDEVLVSIIGNNDMIVS